MYSLLGSMPPSEEFIQSVQAAHCCCLARPMDIPPECWAPTFADSRFCHCLLGWCCTCFQHSQSCKLSRSPNNLLFPSDLLALETAYLCVNCGKCSSLPQDDFCLWSWDEHQMLGSLLLFSFPWLRNSPPSLLSPRTFKVFPLNTLFPLANHSGRSFGGKNESSVTHIYANSLDPVIYIYLHMHT